MIKEKKASRIILGSLLGMFLLLSGTVIGMSYYRYVRHSHAKNDAYRIIAILQTSPNEELLKTAYLSELLELSTDKPTNLYRFNTAEAKKKLLSAPMIKEVTVKKIRPGTVHVDYQLRQPVAVLSDYSNTLVDSDGVMFPHKPFFTPKKIPEVYLGIAQEEASAAMSRNELFKKRFDFAIAILNVLKSDYCLDNTYIKRVDVSKVNAASYGLRQIVVVLEDRVEKEIDGRSLLFIHPRILRLDVHDYKQGLANYKVLHQHLLKQDQQIIPANSSERCICQPAMTIDLRLPQLAFFNTLPVKG